MKKSILVVEDDDGIRESLQDLLEQEGYQVFGAENGMKGLDILSNKNHSQPSLIILDLSMPLMNGCEFLKVQKSNPNWKSIPAIVFTAAGGKNKPELADGFISKPIHIDHLFEVIEKYCA